MFNCAFILQALLHPYWVPGSVPSSGNKIVSNKGTMRVVICPDGKKRNQLRSLAGKMVAVPCYWRGKMLVSHISLLLVFWKRKLRASMSLNVYTESQASVCSEKIEEIPVASGQMSSLCCAFPELTDRRGDPMESSTETASDMVFSLTSRSSLSLASLTNLCCANSHLTFLRAYPIPKSGAWHFPQRS